jgi:hypothetical protein
MKNLVLAFVIILIAALTIFAIGHALTINTELVDAAAALPLAGCSQILELLEKREAKRKLTTGQQGAIQSLDGFSISWPLMAAYGTIILIAVTQIVSGLTGAITAASGINGAGALIVIGLVGLLTELLAGYFVGRWVGTRSRNHGIIAIFVMSSLSAVLARVIDFYLLPADAYQIFGVEKSMTLFFTGTLGSFLLLLLPALLGYWRGSRLRMVKYLRFLLAILPADTQVTLIDLAFQEANRVRLQKSKT